MAEFRTEMRGRLRRVRAVVSSLLALMIVTVAPAYAQTQSPTPLQVLEVRINDLKGIVDQAKKDASQTDRIGEQVDKVNEQLVRVKASNQEANRINTTPIEAWLTLGGLGALFVVAWGIVSWRRETTRQIEEKNQATVKEAKATEEAFDERVKLIVAMLRETQKTQVGAMSASELKRAIELVEALMKIFRRGLQTTDPPRPADDGIAVETPP